MRLTFILLVTLVASSATALSSDKAAIENGAVVGVDSTLAEGARLLRGEYSNDILTADGIVKKKADNGDDDLDDGDLDDDFDEERTLGDVVKKLNPITAVKKAMLSSTAKQPLKADEAYQEMIKRV